MSCAPTTPAFRCAPAETRSCFFGESPGLEPRCKIADMPLYMVEREFADELEVSGEEIRLLDAINADEGVRGIFSFRSAARRQTYCLYEAPSPEAIIAAARRSDLPADAVVEVGAASPELVGRLRAWAAADGRH